MGVSEKRRVSCGSLPTRQKIREAKIKGTCSKAILCEYTLAVPCCVTVCGRWSAADMGAIYGTQSTVEEWMELRRAFNFRRNRRIGIREPHICCVEGGCRKCFYNMFKIPEYYLLETAKGHSSCCYSLGNRVQ